MTSRTTQYCQTCGAATRTPVGKLCRDCAGLTKVRHHQEARSPELKSCEPTSAIPGTPEKIQVLTDRLWAGQRMWHPRDANFSAANRVAVVISTEVDSEDDE